MMDNNHIRNIIEKFYMDNFYDVQSKLISQSILEINYFHSEDLYPTTKMKLYVNFTKECVAKFNANTEHESLLCKELRLFDNLNYNLCPQAEEETKQVVTDWWQQNNCNNEYIAKKKNSEIIENGESFTKKQNNMNQNLKQNNNEFILNMYIDPVTQEKVDFVQWVNELLNKKDIDLRDLSGMISSDVKYALYNKPNYNPSKETAISLAIGLELNVDEAQELMHKAGFHLSEFIEYDKIILSAIENEFGIFETNVELLKIQSKTPESKNISDRYQYSKKLLGPESIQREAWKKTNK